MGKTYLKPWNGASSAGQLGPTTTAAFITAVMPSLQKVKFTRKPTITKPSIYIASTPRKAKTRLSTPDLTDRNGVLVQKSATQGVTWESESTRGLTHAK